MSYERSTPSRGGQSPAEMEVNTMIKLTDIIKQIIDKPSVEWEDFGYWQYYIHATEDGQLVDTFSKADITVCARPDGGWDVAGDSPETMYNEFEREDNLYFVSLCKDLLDQIRAAGYEVEDDSSTLPDGEWIDPPEIDAEQDEADEDDDY